MTGEELYNRFLANVASFADEEMQQGLVPWPFLGGLWRSAWDRTAKNAAASEQPEKPAKEELHTLYRFFDGEGQLLYVGITNNPAARLGSHRDQKTWWADVAEVKLEQFPTREALSAAERQAIQAERPLHNVRLIQGEERVA